MEPIPSLLAWLLRASWQTSILILIVLAVQWLFRHRLTPRWRYGLWLLVVARTLLPAAPSSAWSVFNLTGSYPPATSLTFQTPSPSPIANREMAGVPAVKPYTPSVAASVASPGTTGPSVPASAISIPGVASPHPTPSLSATSRSRQSSYPAIVFFFIWLAGFVWMGARNLIPQVRFRSRLRQETEVGDPQVLSLLRDCGQVMNLRFVPRVIQTRAVRTPSLLGFWRPCLLLPTGTVAALNAAELRYVFLHELAHIQRRDMPVQWLMTFIKAVHWFNPLFWIAAGRLGAACELACDHWVLARLQGHENRAYGATIVKLLEQLSGPAPLPGLIGMAEDKRRLFERITAIRDFKMTTKISVAGLAVLAFVAIVCLTDPRRRDDGQAAQQGNPRPVVTVPLSRSNAPLKLFISHVNTGLKYYFVLPDGTLWLWDTTLTFGTNATFTPRPVGTNTDWVKVQTFQDHGVALRRDGTLWEWGGRAGGESSGQLVPLNLGGEWRDIAVGSHLLVALKKEGTLWGLIDGSWFPHASGPLPSGMCQIGTNKDWVSVGGGKEAYGPAAREDGSLWTWDLSSWSTNAPWSGRFPEPTRLGNDAGWRIIDSYAPALAVSDRGDVWDATTLFERIPGQLTGLLYAHNAAPDRFALVPGEKRRPRACEIRDDGTLWEKAYASDPPDPPFPHQVGNRSDWIAIWWGWGTVVGLTSDGTIWTWGGDPTARPVWPPPPSRVRRAYEQVQSALGIKPSTPIRSFPYPQINEPRPIMRLVQATPE